VLERFTSELRLDRWDTAGVTAAHGIRMAEPLALDKNLVGQAAAG